MSSLRRISTAIALTTVTAAGVVPVAGAANAGVAYTVVQAKQTLIQKRPGAAFVGSMQRGDVFHVTRSATIAKGASKGVWRHGYFIAHSKKGAFHVTGWARGSALKKVS